MEFLNIFWYNYGMNIKLDAIQIFVSNIKSARKWYEDILGMQFIKKYTEIKCLEMKLNNITFYIETPCSAWGEGWDKVKIGGRMPIILQTPNIQATVMELKNKGVKFVEEISKRPWGEDKAVFCDPDGNEFNLI